MASLDDFRALLQVQQETGRAVQVGFQSLGSRALQMLTEDALGIGRLVRVSAVGTWSRTVGYWTRSPWAGRRSLRGQPVVDGVVTNALRPRGGHGLGPSSVAAAWTRSSRWRPIFTGPMPSTATTHLSSVFAQRRDSW